MTPPFPLGVTVHITVVVHPVDTENVCIVPVVQTPSPMVTVTEYIGPALAVIVVLGAVAPPVHAAVLYEEPDRVPGFVAAAAVFVTVKVGAVPLIRIPAPAMRVVIALLLESKRRVPLISPAFVFVGGERDPALI